MFSMFIHKIIYFFKKSFTKERRYGSIDKQSQNGSLKSKKDKKILDKKDKFMIAE